MELSQNTIQTVLVILLALTWIKSITIGSSFNFHKLFKHGKKYIDEYIDWKKNEP